MTNIELVDAWRMLVQMNLDQDGYMVGWSKTPMRMWELMPQIPGAEVDEPFHVVGEATREDALRQWRRGQVLTSEVLIPPPYGGYFYKLCRVDGKDGKAAA